MIENSPNRTTSVFTTFLGIDPGLDGAAALLNQDGALIAHFDLPTLEKGGFARRRVDPEGLAEVLLRLIPFMALAKSWDVTVSAAIECVGYRKGDGGASGASLAHSMGVCEGVLAGLGISTVLRPPPDTWKRAMGLRGAGKAGAVARAAELWPTLKGQRHDVAEAALLARFAWLQRSMPHARTPLERVQTAADVEP